MLNRSTTSILELKKYILQTIHTYDTIDIINKTIVLIALTKGANTRSICNYTVFDHTNIVRIIEDAHTHFRIEAFVRIFRNISQTRIRYPMQHSATKQLIVTVITSTGPGPGKDPVRREIGMKTQMGIGNLYSPPFSGGVRYFFFQESLTRAGLLLRLL